MKSITPKEKFEKMTADDFLDLVDSVNSELSAISGNLDIFEIIFEKLEPQMRDEINVALCDIFQTVKNRLSNIDKIIKN